MTTNQTVPSPQGVPLYVLVLAGSGAPAGDNTGLYGRLTSNNVHLARYCRFKGDPAPKQLAALNVGDAILDVAHVFKTTSQQVDVYRVA